MPVLDHSSAESMQNLEGCFCALRSPKPPGQQGRREGSPFSLQAGLHTAGCHSACFDQGGLWFSDQYQG